MKRHVESNSAPGQSCEVGLPAVLLGNLAFGATGEADSIGERPLPERAALPVEAGLPLAEEERP